VVSLWYVDDSPHLGHGRNQTACLNRQDGGKRFTVTRGRHEPSVA